MKAPGPSHIVNHNMFTDARPTMGSPQATFNPGDASAYGPLPGGPPRNVNPPGRRVVAKGLTNKRIQNTM